MLRTSTLDRPADAPVEGATEIVEAASAEAALAEVHDRLGPEARIVEARRVLRGGVGGFFAKEHVQLHVAPGRGSPGPASDRSVGLDRDGADVAAAPRAGQPDVATGRSPVDRLLRGADDLPETIDFATYLRAQLAIDGAGGRAPATPDVAAPDAPAAAPRATPTATPPVGTPAAPPVASPAAIRWNPDSPPSAPEPPPATDGVAWSATRLLHLGLPASLVHGLVVESGDDRAWTFALAEALEPLCRPLPAGPSILVGPDAPALTDVAGVPAARSEAWVAALGGRHWRHLVLGGPGWRDHLVDEPLAVSWTRPDALPDALRCAAELGLVLGYGPIDGALRRARPLDVALAVRASVGRS